MSLEENKALYRRWFEDVVSARKVDLAEDLLAPHYVMHMPGAPGPLDRAGHLQMLQMFHDGFSDWSETIDDVIAEGDRVVIRVTGSGTHDGPFQGIAPTGKAVRATGVAIGRIEDGRIAESWAEYDALGLMLQLGAFPVPAS